MLRIHRLVIEILGPETEQRARISNSNSCEGQEGFVNE